MRSGIGGCESMSRIGPTHFLPSATKNSTPPSTRRAGRRPAMIDRQEVEDLLADATHPHSYMERVPADTLAALCRAWLAVEDAQTAEVTWDAGSYAYLVFDGGP